MTAILSLRDMTGAQINAHFSTRCGFAEAGTYGHECGKPATLVGVTTSDITKSGVYYARRCASCATIKGGENARVQRFIPFCAETHKNEF